MRKRSNFDLKTVSTLGIIALTLWIGSEIGCKSPSGTDPPDTNYNITVINQDIFNNNDIGGDVILNGTRKASGSSFTVANGQINNLDVDNVGGYIKAYISVRDESGNSVFTRDNAGHHANSVNRGATL